jgi:hypothetical protein
MEGFDEFSRLIEKGLEVLKDVEQIQSQETFTGKDILNCSDLELITLTFENATIILKAIGEDDTITIATKIPSKTLI